MQVKVASLQLREAPLEKSTGTISTNEFKFLPKELSELHAKVMATLHHDELINLSQFVVGNEFLPQLLIRRGIMITDFG